MIEIIAYERRQYDILIGYRHNNRVVYASVPSNLDDATAKQKGYEQMFRALQYEQTLDVPSIDGSDMEPLEVFTPAEPTTTIVKINGPAIVTFDDEIATKIVTYTAVAYDQYGDVVSSQAIEQVFNNTDSSETVSVTIDNIKATLNVAVQAYKESEIEVLKRENTLLKAQNNVLVERTDFHEEVLSEIILTITS